MKKVMIIAALLAGATTFAQRGEHRKERMDLTAEQMATLQTKKMALALDLNEKQQQEAMEIHLENAEFHKTQMKERQALKESGEHQKPSSEERFEKLNARLDRKLAQQEAFKDLLTDEQYAQWKKMSHRKHMHGKKKMQRRGERE